VSRPNIRPELWRDRRVFLTGHTGFKGAWLGLWLERLGARVTGYALPPPTDPSLFELARVDEGLERSHLADVRDRAALGEALDASGAEVVFHLAAQPIVRRSDDDPLETFGINVIGTANLLDAVLACPSVRVVVVVTSDNCYENLETNEAYDESAALGGHDPYSASKAAAEIVTHAYRKSFLSIDLGHGVAVASARAGNVIGGGDWAEDRLVPDVVRALEAGRKVELRYPAAIRPWQHVLEPLSGYVGLAERLLEHGGEFAEAWNFAPAAEDAKPVGWLVERIHQAWGAPFEWEDQGGPRPHEATFLRLDATKARERLGWEPQIHVDETVEWLADWYRSVGEGADARELSLERIAAYEARLDAAVEVGA